MSEECGVPAIAYPSGVHVQAEHERVQSRLFELQESKEAASNASASADDFDKEQREALTQQVR